MLQQRTIQTGDLFLTIYDFPDIGDVLPMHRHTLDNDHICIVARGSFRFHGPSVGDRTLKTGAFVDPGDVEETEHEFIALEPNSRLINIRRYKTKEA